MRIGLGMGITKLRISSDKEFYTDFSEYEPDQQPFDWTRRGDTSNGVFHVKDDEPGAIGGKILKLLNPSGNALRALSWDKLDGLINVRIEMRVLILGGSSNAANIIRGSGAFFSGYLLGYWRNTGDMEFRSHNQTNSLGTDIGSAYLDFYDLGTYHKQIIEVNETTLRSKFWADGEPEPETWLLEITNSDHQDGGYIGVGAYRDNPVGFDTMKITPL